MTEEEYEEMKRMAQEWSRFTWTESRKQKQFGLWVLEVVVELETLRMHWAIACSVYPKLLELEEKNQT